MSATAYAQFAFHPSPSELSALALRVRRASHLGFRLRSPDDGICTCLGHGLPSLRGVFEGVLGIVLRILGLVLGVLRVVGGVLGSCLRLLRCLLLFVQLRR